MPNTLTIVAAPANSTRSVEFAHPVSGAWVAGTAQPNGTSRGVFTGLSAGTYANHRARLAGANPEVLAVDQRAIYVANVAQPPAPAGLSVANDGTVTWTLATGKVASQYEYYVGATTANPSWTVAPAIGFQSGAGIGVLVHLRLRADGTTPAGLEDAASSGGVNYAAAYIVAVEATGALLSQGQKDSVYALEASLKSNGLLSNVSRSDGAVRLLYPMLGGTSEAHAVNFVNPNLNRITWFGSPLHSANGVQFNGVNQQGDTQFSAGLLPDLSNHMLYYAAEAVADPDRGGQGVMGTAIDGVTSLVLAYNRGLNSYYVSAGDTGLVAWAQGSTKAGLLLGVRTASTAAALYHAGSLVGSSTAQATGSVSTAAITIGRVNVNGQYSLVPCSLAGAGLGLSDTQAAAYSSILQDFQAANGRAR